MLVTISSLANPNKKVVVVGKTTSTPEKLGYESKRTIGGKPVIKHGVVVTNISIELKNIREEQRDIIDFFWRKNIRLELVTEKFEIINGHIDSNTLPFEETPYEGEVLYSVKFNFIS